MRDGLLRLGNPRKALRRMHELIGELCQQLQVYCALELQESEKNAMASAAANTTTTAAAFTVTTTTTITTTTTTTTTAATSTAIAAAATSTTTAATTTSTSTAAAATTMTSVVTEAVASTDASTFGAIVGAMPTMSSTLFAAHKYGDSNAEQTDNSDIKVPSLYLNETFDLMLGRWEKLNKDFKDKVTDRYDLTKVPDVYDMIRYDVLHNSHVPLNGIEELFHLSMAFADCVVPQEYGIHEVDKRFIGAKMCSALLEKLKYDLEVAQKGSSDMRYMLTQY